MKSRLTAPLQKFVKEAMWLNREFHDATHLPAHSSASTHQLTQEMCVIQLNDAWARFCREVVILSAVGRTNTLSGSYIDPAPQVLERAHVIPILLHSYPRRRYIEPNWHQAKECITAITNLAISNRVTLRDAIGVVDSPAEDLRRVRNYFAHRGEGTGDHCWNTGLFVIRGRYEPNSLKSYVAGGSTIFESWAKKLCIMARAAVD